ncbi:hypothetical protein TNIN_444381 [Trichonephila inaurata madagascariensis]|uniref:BPTI/Kunitz inhibitor domain-containing protein n=1 Tax=Trichonephila inaurata madagascariensis TaxID=2747483 RepID=A0A8X6Y8Y4_9ARAC|nr:hypothetical protein TNIN_444381 [Trichonephila inaurata madagascariensis]
MPYSGVKKAQPYNIRKKSSKIFYDFNSLSERKIRRMKLIIMFVMLLLCVISESSNPCTLPMNKGGCQNEIRRWFYDKENYACRMFVYGGCGGNGNNFETQDECEKICQRGWYEEE